MKRFVFVIAAFVAITLAAPSRADDMWNSMTISAHGMKAQSERSRVISENIANSSTGALTPDSDPYRRKIITFQNKKDRDAGIDLVKVKDITADKKSDFVLKYMPDHPGADASGYVKMPNISMVTEITDMKEAQRSYEANLGMMETSRTMAQRTIDMLR